MKKLFIVLLALAATMSTYAQQIKVYNNSDSVPTAVYVNNKLASYMVVFSKKEYDANGHEYVDLGLPSGTLWSTCDLGSASPELEGQKFAWGELETKENFSIFNYRWYDESLNEIFKYNDTDNKCVLEQEDDAAYAIWGGDWRLPSVGEFNELLEYCNWAISRDTHCYRVTSKVNKKSILIRWDDKSIPTCYWTNSKNNCRFTDAEVLSPGKSSNLKIYKNSRVKGNYIRPVMGGNKIKADSIVLNKSIIDINVNNKQQLTATVYPSITSNQSLLWTSLNPEVATVDQNGNVTGVDGGTAIITCRIADGSDMMASCEVRVRKICVSRIIISQSKATLDPGDSLTLTATFSPNTTSNTTCIWTTSDPSVATVVDGVVKGVSEGTATIVCMSADDNNTKVGCSVTVNPIKLSGIKLGRTSLSLYVGEKSSIAYSVSPINAANKNVTWESSDVTVMNMIDGYVTAIGPGTATLTCKAADGSGKSASCTVTVTAKKVSNVSLLSDIVEIPLNQNKKIYTQTTPLDAYNKQLTWTSSKPSVATVNSEGIVTPVAKGYTIITCKTTDGSNITKTVTVSVVSSSILDHEFVDLGLPSGTLWATCNIGASYNYVIGSKFRWGEVEPYKENTRYKWLDASGNYTKYTNSQKVLEDQDDAAAVNWGGLWRIPSQTEMQELINYCNVSLKQIYNVDVLEFSNTYGSIYIPATNINSQTFNIWLNQLAPNSYSDASCFIGNKTKQYYYPEARTQDHAIRPVWRGGIKKLTSIVLADNQVTMIAGNSRTLQVRILPDSPDNNDRVKWLSFNSNVAYYDKSTGKIVAKSVGTTTLVCEATDGSGVCATCVVTVK